MNRDDDFPSEGMSFAIKQLMIKHFEPCVNKSIVKCVDKGVFDNDEVNALEIVAQEINNRMNRKFKRLFKCFPVNNTPITSEFEYLALFGVYPFKGFRQKQEFHISEKDVFSLIMTSKAFKHFQSLLINDDSEEGDDNCGTISENDEYIENDSDGFSIDPHQS